jgi:translation initiation factor 3 subunit J
MASWDDDDYEVTTAKPSVIVSRGKWEGEDEDDDNIPVLSPPTIKLMQDEWDADSEDDKPKVAAVAPPPKQKKSVKQAIAEREERERKEAEERALRKVDTR